MRSRAFAARRFRRSIALDDLRLVSAVVDLADSMRLEQRDDDDDDEEDEDEDEELELASELVDLAMVFELDEVSASVSVCFSRWCVRFDCLDSTNASN